MNPHLTVLTLGVDDLERAVAFYRDGLGWATKGIVGQEFEWGAAAFFNLAGGLKLALWPRRSMAAETGLQCGPPDPTALALGHNVASTAAVDEVLRQAAAAGAQIRKSAGPTFWGGYAGWFQDPDGHLWEVVYNPHLAALG